MEETIKEKKQPLVKTPTSEQAPPISETPKAKPKFKFPILMLGVVAFLILIGIVSASFVLNAKQKPNQESKTTVKVSPAIYPTANRKTYSNNVAGFSFQHPSPWSVKNISENSLNLNHPNDPEISTVSVSFPIRWFTNKKDVEENSIRHTFDTKSGKWGYIAYDNIAKPGEGYNMVNPHFVEDKPFSSTESGASIYCSYFEGGADYLIPLSDNLFIVIRADACLSSYDPSSYANLDFFKVLKSFTLTGSDQNQEVAEKDLSTNIADWKTYEDPKVNFSTKYPVGLSVIPEDGVTTFQFYPKNQSIECAKFNLSFADISSSQDLGKWVKEKFPTRGNAGPPGQNQTPSEIYPYTNSIDKTITGYWMPTGAEVEGKIIFIKHNDKVAALVFPGCAGAGDTYKAHPIAMSVMEKMITTFKFTK